MWVIRYWKPLCALALACALYGWGYFNARTAGLVALQVERNRAEQIIADYAKAEADAKAKAWEKEREMLAYVTELSRRHQQELKDAKAREDRRVADLESGALRLRREIGALYTERLSNPAATAGELSEEARRGAELISAAIGVGATCDAQVKGLQDAYNATREPGND